MVLDLDVVVLAEDAQILFEHLQRLRFALLQDSLENFALQATGGRHQPGAVLSERLLVEARLVVVAVRITQRGELDEVAVALEVLGEQDLVVARPVGFVAHP